MNGQVLLSLMGAPLLSPEDLRHYEACAKIAGVPYVSLADTVREFGDWRAFKDWADWYSAQGLVQ